MLRKPIVLRIIFQYLCLPIFKPILENIVTHRAHNVPHYDSKLTMHPCRSGVKHIFTYLFSIRKKY